MSARTSPVSDQILVEDGELKDGYVFAIGDEALIFSEPVVPLEPCCKWAGWGDGGRGWGWRGR